MNENEEEYIDIDVDDNLFEGMMPCDYSGICSGISCKNYLNCMGK